MSTGDPQLPVLPVPAPPQDPACDWCGARPAQPYEADPPVYTSLKTTGTGKEKITGRIIKKRAVIAYACKHHRDIFDRQKAEKQHGRGA